MERPAWILPSRSNLARYWKTIGRVALVVAAIVIPLVVENQYYVHLLIMVCINTVLAVTFVFMFRMGLINMSIAAFWGIGAYASALLLTKGGAPFWAALFLAALIAGITALVLGLLLVRVPGNCFVILSIVLGMIVVQVFGTFKFFGAHVGITKIPGPSPITIPLTRMVISFGTQRAYYYLVLLVVVVLMLVYAGLSNSSPGRAWRAMGLRSNLAETLGVATYKYRLLGFAIASATAGLMGSLYASYVTAIVPGSFDVFKTIYIQVYAIVGGLGSLILGPLIGSSLMTVLPEMMRSVEAAQPIFVGLILIGVILFFPGGILGLFKSRRSDPFAIRFAEATAKVRRAMMGRRTKVKS